MKKIKTFEQAVKIQSQAIDKYEMALSNGEVWYLAKPGYFAIRAAADKQMITRMASRREGYKCMSQCEYNKMLKDSNLE